MEPKANFKQRIQSEGRWDAYLARREQLTKELQSKLGCDETSARKQASSLGLIPAKTQLDELERSGKDGAAGSDEVKSRFGRHGGWAHSGSAATWQSAEDAGPDRLVLDPRRSERWVELQPRVLRRSVCLDLQSAATEGPLE